MKLCFFFGSLRTGYWNQRVLSKDAKRVGLAHTVEPMALYIDDHGAVPTSVPTTTGPSLKGDLYELNERDAQQVDWLEAGYKSGVFTVATEDGALHEATIYYHDKPEDCPYIRKPVLVPSGDYTLAVSPNGERING